MSLDYYFEYEFNRNTGFSSEPIEYYIECYTDDEYDYVDGSDYFDDYVDDSDEDSSDKPLFERDTRNDQYFKNLKKHPKINPKM